MTAENLPEDLRSFVHGELGSGRYRSLEELFAEGVRLLREREAFLDEHGRVPSRVENEKGAFFRWRNNHRVTACPGGGRNAPWASVPGKFGLLRAARRRWVRWTPFFGPSRVDVKV